MNGDVNELGDAGVDPGKSCLFSLTVRNPEIDSLGARVRRLVEPDVFRRVRCVHDGP